MPFGIIPRYYCPNVVHCHYASSDHVYWQRDHHRGKGRCIGVHNDGCGQRLRVGEPINWRPRLAAAALAAVLVLAGAGYGIKLAYFPDLLEHITFVTSETRAVDTQGVLTITIARTSGVGRRETVEYYSIDGTARGGEDYQPIHGTLSFAPGEKQQRLLVSLLPHTSWPAQDRHFFVALKNVVNNPRHVVFIAQKRPDRAVEQQAEALVRAASTVAMDIGTYFSRVKILSEQMDSFKNDATFPQYQAELKTNQGNLTRARELYIQQLRDMQAIEPNILKTQIDHVVAQQERDGFTQQSLATRIMKGQLQEFLQSKTMSMDRWTEQLGKIAPNPTREEPGSSI